MASCRVSFCLLLLSFFLDPSYAKKSYIVYLGTHSHSSLDAIDHEQVRDSHHEFLTSFLGSKANAKESIFHSYTIDINGFAAKLEEDEVIAIRRHPGVVSVFEDCRRVVQTTRSWEFMGVERDGETLPHSAWEKANYGDGVIVATLDTGVWPESESFSDKGYGPVPAKWKGFCQNETDPNGVKCNRKLIGARYFDAGYSQQQDAEGFLTPRDSNGHGTHTLSTAAGNFVHGAHLYGHGNGTAKGGAPKARVATYKVCWRRGCLDSDVIAAFDAAIGDGVDVLSMSLSAFPIPTFKDGMAIGAFHAMRRGIVVVAAAGNDGPRRYSVPNTAPWFFTVAASTMDRDFISYVTLGNNLTLEGQSVAEGAALPNRFYPLVTGEQIAFSNATTLDARFCVDGSLSPEQAKGKIVLCCRGLNNRVPMGLAVKKAGGVGVIVYNDDMTGKEIDPISPHFLPAADITQEDGQKILEYIVSTSSPVALISPPKTLLGRKSPVMANFSSSGPSFDIRQILKPDITAPGVNVLAAFSEFASPSGSKLDTRRVKFNLMSGTSMACPHVAGVVALVKAAHPNWSPAAIKSAIMTTARIRDNEKVAMVDAALSKASPFNYGSGHVKPNPALDPGLVYDIGTHDYLDYLCAIGYTPTQIAAVSGSSYACPSPVPSIEKLNYPAMFFKGLTNTSTILRTLKNVGGSPATYKVRVQSPDRVSIKVKPSTLEFRTLGEEKKFTIIASVRANETAGYTFGRLIWSDGNHFVRSPIVVEIGLAPDA